MTTYTQLRLGHLACLIVVGMGFTCLSGCLGPASLRGTRSHYNHAVRKTDNEELLLNLVRLRYEETIAFLPVSGLNAQFEFNLSGDFGESETKRTLLGRVGFADRPTLTFSPQRSREFTKAILGRIPLETVYVFSRLGFDIDAVLRLYVRNINGVPNAPSGGGPMPKTRPEFEQFRAFSSALTSLEKQRMAVLEVKNRETEVPDVGFPTITPENLATLKKAGYGVRRKTDKTYVATTSTPVTFARFHPSALHSPELAQIVQMLRLRPMQTSYELEESVGGQLKPLPPFEQSSTIKITTRSILEVMYLMAKAIDVPEEHVKEGLARVTFNPDGSYFDWNDVLGDLFRVHVATWRPKRAAVAVRYRGYWFYINDTDHSSKTTLSLFNELLRLQTVGAAEGQPVLTLPLGS